MMFNHNFPSFSFFRMGLTFFMPMARSENLFKRILSVSTSVGLVCIIFYSALFLSTPLSFFTSLYLPVPQSLSLSLPLFFSQSFLTFLSFSLNLFLSLHLYSHHISRLYLSFFLLFLSHCVCSVPIKTDD